ncbi:DMT family transporter [uncultured Maritalea sp.]|uniref:DMT family transporter n=1 Tax=uncultured Maritalea sp. TaxID=757249 RepID=UPI00260C2065|nr:DMT family transporter [uncultured Maritalea sp.]
MQRSQPLKAAYWMAGAMASFSLMAIAGRELGGLLDTFEIMMYRSFLGVFIVVAVGNFAGTLGTIGFNQIKLHALRNVSHFVGQNLWFYAVTIVPLSQLFAFEFSAPLWVIVLAPIFLGEKLTATKAFAAVLGFTGILIVARPGYVEVDPAIIAAAACAIFFAGTTMATKKLTGTQSTTSILFWLVVMHSVLGLVCAGFDGQIAVPEGMEIVLVAAIGVCGLLAHFCITNALNLAPATVVTPLEFLRLPLIAFIGFVLYQEAFEWPVIVGAALVLAANTINIRAENARNKQIAARTA